MSGYFLERKLMSCGNERKEVFKKKGYTERNVLEATEMGFFECKALLKAEVKDNQLKGWEGKKGEGKGLR